MKKYLLLIPALVLIGAGCQTNSTVNSNANVAVNNSNTEAFENVNQVTNVNTEGDVDTSDWKTYTNEEYGFSFKYPNDWEIIIATEAGLGTNLGDIKLSKDNCEIHIDKPTRASDDIIKAFTTNELRGSAVEVLTINGFKALKQVGPVNAGGDVGESYRIMNDDSEVSLFVMQSGLASKSCVDNYQNVIKSIVKL